MSGARLGRDDGTPGASYAGHVGAFAAALPVALLLLASWYQGAFATRHWAPVAFLAIAILAAAAVAGGLIVPERPARLALVALWALAVWALLSALWGDSPAAAVEGAGRSALYAALFTIASTLACARDATRVGTLLVVGVAAIAAVTLLRLLADGTDLFLAGRLDAPVGYRNATGCLFALAVWPLVAAAARRDANAILRALALSMAVVLLGLAFLTQARGVALALVAGGAVALALGPDRIRRAWAALGAVAAVGAVSGVLLEPFRAFSDDGGEVSHAEIAAAAEALTWVAVAVFAVGLVVALADGGIRLEAGARTVVRRALAAGLVVVALGVVAGGLATVGDPVEFVDARVSEFRSLETAAAGDTRFTFGGGQRADLWRVALVEFSQRPVTGVGEGSYEFGYYRERRSDRNLSAPHGLPFRIAAELGIVGLGCLALFVAGLMAAVASRWRAASPSGRRHASALLAAGTVGLAQGAVDWLWLIPAITGLSFLALGLAVAVLRPAAADGPRSARSPSGAGLAARVATAGPLFLAACLVAVLYLGDVALREVRQIDPSRPSERLSAAERAERLNPWSTEPLYLQAGALENLGRRRAGRDRLRAALELEPDSFVTFALLGDLETRAGRPRRARVYYRRALALNPRDTGLRQLVRMRR